MILIQILYFLAIGWWLGGLASLLAYLMMLSILFLPIGIMILNRLPTLMYLKPAGESSTIAPSGVTREQLPFILRVIWFFFLGWHFGLYLLGIAYLCMLSVIGLPLGIFLLNRVPFVLTLSRNYD